MDFGGISEEEKQVLEMFSNKVRQGELIGFQDALIVIEYQSYLKKQRRENGVFARLKGLFRK